MNFLGTFFINLLGSVFTYFVKYLGKRLSLVIAVITFLAGLATAFFSAIYALLATIQFTMSESSISYALSVLWPVHVSVCISVIFSAEITRWVYDRSTFYVGLFWEAAGR